MHTEERLIMKDYLTQVFILINLIVIFITINVKLNFNLKNYIMKKIKF